MLAMVPWWLCLVGISITLAFPVVALTFPVSCNMAETKKVDEALEKSED